MLFFPLSLFGYTDGNLLQFEDGYLVETVVEGNELGVVPYKIRVSQDGELFAVDAVSSNIVKITPPLSRCKLLATFLLSLCLNTLHTIVISFKLGIYTLDWRRFH